MNHVFLGSKLNSYYVSLGNTCVAQNTSLTCFFAKLLASARAVVNNQMPLQLDLNEGFFIKKAAWCVLVATAGVANKSVYDNEQTSVSQTIKVFPKVFPINLQQSSNDIVSMFFLKQ